MTGRGQGVGEALGKATGRDNEGLGVLSWEDLRVAFMHLKGCYWEEEFDILAAGLPRRVVRNSETLGLPATFLPGSPSSVAGLNSRGAQPCPQSSQSDIRGRSAGRFHSIHASPFNVAQTQHHSCLL